MKNNKIIFFLIPFILLNLTSCNNTEVNIEEQNNSQEKINPPVYNFKSNNIDKIENNKESKLIIDERCIWCNKCVRFAPENFIMNFKTFKAEVISSENLDSPWVQRSIEICPTNSIKITTYK